MRDHGLKPGSFELLCACLILAPCLTLAQQSAARNGAAVSADSTARSAPAAAGDLSRTAPSGAPGASSAAPPHGAPAKGAEDLEPAVDTSATSPSGDAPAGKASTAAAPSPGIAQPDAPQARTGRGAKQGRSPREAAGRPSGKTMDRLELGTTDITGNRELPKVMYIVPWKRSDLGDLTGKPLNSLIDQTLEPVDRNVFERSNRYYDAVTAGAEAAGGSQDTHRTPEAGSGSAVRDER